MMLSLVWGRGGPGGCNPAFSDGVRPFYHPTPPKRQEGVEL